MCRRYVLCTPNEVVKLSQLELPTPPRVKPEATGVPQPELEAALTPTKLAAAASMTGNS